MTIARASIVVAAILLAGCGGSHPGGSRTAPQSPRSHVVTRPLPGAQATRVEIPTGSGHLAAMSGPRGLVLRDRPGGRVIAHLLSTTAYGSPTVVWAAKRRGDWLGVVSASVPNNKLGWLDVQRDRPRMWRTHYRLIASLGRRVVAVYHGAHLLRTIPVTIGSPATPTPTGRFEVTDKLLPDRESGYGCCIVALSGHQPILRPGWAGGDRIAIHGSPAQLVGSAASAGCLRARDSDLRWLMKRIPLGTPAYISA